MTTGDTVWNINWPDTWDGASFYQEYPAEPEIFNDPNLVEERRCEGMNLRETVRALEARNISVAIDLGVHSHCVIDSNCPRAVELRRIITDAGVTLVELIEAYSESIEEVPDIVDYTQHMPEVTAAAHLSVAGKDIEIDLKDMVGEQVKHALERKLYDIRGLEAQVRSLGSSLYQTYKGQIEYLRNNRQLPQLRFPVEELTRFKCLISTLDNSYLILFPTKYTPEYLVDSGIRYELAQEDKNSTRRDPTYICFEITNGNRIRHITLRDGVGIKLQHYHGNINEDCWGNLHIPERWDGTLNQLYRVAREYSGSLVTINRNSLMSSGPPDMPSIGSITDRATRLGREGEVSTQAAPPVDEVVTFRLHDEDEQPTPRRRTGGWGTQAREEG